MKAKKKVGKPSGTILVARIRAKCNNHTSEQREAYIEKGMSIIYGAPETNVEWANTRRPQAWPPE